MAHAAELEESPHERALVPLLDMIFQILMFFIMCVNFVTEQVNEDIKLPRSQAARPMDKSEVDVLFLNLNADGKLIVMGRENPLTLPEIKVWLKQQYSDAERISKDGKVRTAIIIRADQLANYADVFKVMQACKEAKYTKLKLRAITKAQAQPS